MFILTSFSFQNINFSMNTGIEGDQNSEKVDKVKQDIDIKKDNSKALLNQVPSTGKQSLILIFITIIEL